VSRIREHWAGLDKPKGAAGVKGMRVQVYGFEELDSMFAHAMDPLGYRVLVHLMRKAARPLITTMRAMCPVSSKREWISARGDYKKGAFSTQIRWKRPGDLKKSIGTVVQKKRTSRTPIMWVGPRYGKKATLYDGWYFHFIEWGTGPRRHKSGKSVGRISGKGFIRRSWDVSRAAVEYIFNYRSAQIIQDYIDKHAPKYY